VFDSPPERAEPDEEDDRSHDGHAETSQVEARHRPEAEAGADPASEDRAHDPDRGRRDEPTGILAGQESAREQARDEAEDGPGEKTQNVTSARSIPECGDGVFAASAAAETARTGRIPPPERWWRVRS
jgi:hypothetical protein